METADLPMVLAWRNLPEVRTSMYTTHVISREEHAAWFARVMGDATKQYFVYCEGDEPLGVVNFVQLSPQHKNAHWGFYSGVPDRRGVGTRLGAAALDHAFRVLDLEKLCGEALRSNKRSVALHRKLGFRTEGLCFRDVLVGTELVDVQRFAAFRSDWIAEGRTAMERNIAGEDAGDPMRVGTTFGASLVVGDAEIQGGPPGPLSISVIERALSLLPVGEREVICEQARCVGRVNVGEQLAISVRVATRMATWSVIEVTVALQGQAVLEAELELRLRD